MKTIILGPPGTGKTTTLLDLVDEFIRAGTHISKIGYFSFTKKAAWEASTRAEEKFMPVSYTHLTLPKLPTKRIV